MDEDETIVKLQGRSQILYRRDHIKADGRSVSLYGFSSPSGLAGLELVGLGNHRSELRRDPLRNTWAIYSPHRQSRTFMPARTADPLAPWRAGSAPTEIPFSEFELAIFDNQFSSLQTGDAGSDRYLSLFERGAAYVLPFENRGQEVGVTLPHPHGQIYSFDIVPEPQAAASRAFASGYDLAADHASWNGTFDVASDDGFVAFSPPFARFPFETWIMPKQPCRGPWELGADDIHALARILGDIPRRLDGLFGAPMPYMMSFQAAPREAGDEFQFTVQFFPIMRDACRLKYLASVEQFTGVFTVDVVPEQAAERLRAL